MQFRTSILMALASAMQMALATPVPNNNSTLDARGTSCDPVGCYPSTSFSVLGNFDGNSYISGSIYYQDVKTDFSWACNNHYYGFDSNLPYVFSIMETSGLYCDDRYDQTYMKYGDINASPVSVNPDCSQTAEYSYRCIFRADGANGSGL